MKSNLLSVVFILTFSVVILPLFGSPSHAAQSATKGTIVGFEFGVNYLLPSDSKFKGSSNTFTLAFPVENDLTLGVYHETVSLRGKEGAANATVSIDINELRIRREVRDKASIFLGIGSASVTNGISTSAPVADIGARYVALDSMGTVFKTNVSIDLLYRMLSITATTPAGWTTAVDELGGFAVGVNIAILF